MSIIQYWWSFDGDEFASRIGRLQLCGKSKFTENCICYSRELLDGPSNWAEAISNIGGWDKASIIREFADVESNSLDLALLILVLESCRYESDPVDVDASVRISLSELQGMDCPDSVSILERWTPPSTSSNSFVVPNSKLIAHLAGIYGDSPANVLRSAVEGNDLLCISSG